MKFPKSLYLATAFTTIFGILGANNLKSISENPVYAWNVKALESRYVKNGPYMAGGPDTRCTKIEPGGGVTFGLQHDRWALNRQGHDMEMRIRGLNERLPRSFEITGTAEANGRERSSQLPYFRSAAEDEVIHVSIPEGYEGMNKFKLINKGERDLEVDWIKACDSTSEEIEVPERLTGPEFPSQVFYSKNVVDPENSIGGVDGISTLGHYRCSILYVWDEPFFNGPGDDLEAYGRVITPHGFHSYGVFAWGEKENGESARIFLGRGGTPPEGGAVTFDLGELKKADVVKIIFMDQGKENQQNFPDYLGEPPVLELFGLRALYPGDF